MPNKYIFIFGLLFSLLLPSCQELQDKQDKREVKKIKKTSMPQQKEMEIFYEKNFPKWISVFDAQILNEHFINTDEYIVGPERTWQKLLKLDFLGSENFKQLSSCIFFKLASNRSYLKKPLYESKDSLGELKVFNIPTNEKCDNSYFLKKSSNFIKNIVNFMVFLTDHQAKNVKNIGPIPPYHLFFLLEVYDFQKKKTVFSSLKFPLYNLKMGRLKLNLREKVQAPSRIHQRYHSSVQQRILPGVILFSLKKEGEDSPGGTIPKMLGQLQDDYATDGLVKCHDVNDECETTQEFTCDRCRYGWFEVVGPECPKGGPKYCGVNLCGGPKRPACPRGEHLSTIQGMQQCQHGSLAGFCHQNEETFCDENQTLICL